MRRHQILFPKLFPILCLFAVPCAASPLFDSAYFGVPVRDKPYAVTAGDLTGDGIDDLVVADSDGAAILVANSDSTFQPQRRLDIERVTKLAIASLTDDRVADLVVLPADSAVVRVYPGRGDGSFEAPIDLPFVEGARGLVADDLNGDGHADLAAAGGITVRTWIAIRGGGFAPPNTILLGLDTNGLLAGDVDRDGLPDLLVLHKYQAGFTLLRNTGAGTFGAPVVYVAPSGSSLAATGDFDGDGSADIAIPEGSVYGVPDGINVWYGRPDGTLGTPRRVLTVISDAEGTAAADFDRDGRDDLVVARANGFVVHRGSGTGVSAETSFAVVSYSGAPVVVGNFDTDGRPDVCSLEWSPDGGGLSLCGLYLGSSAFVWRGEGDGGFHSPLPLAGSTDSRRVIATDFDGDGAVDVFATTAAPALVAYHGLPGGAFDTPVVVPLPSIANSLQAIDVDGDDRPEIVMTIGTGAIPGQILLFDLDAAGVPHVRPPIVLNGSAFGLAAGDFDRDGRLDFAVTDPLSHGLHIVLGAAGGTWIAHPMNLGARSLPIVAVDLDRDGVLDLMLSVDIITTGQTVLLGLRGAGDGSFTIDLAVPQALAVRSLTVAPPDGGDATIAAAEGLYGCSGPRGGVVLLRAIPGTLVPSAEPIVMGAIPTQVLFGDVTGDGRLDLVAATTLGRISVRAGLPDGVFEERHEFGIPSGVFGLALADVDHDGRLDVVACSPSGVFVLGNRGGAQVDSSHIAARIGGGPADAILARGRTGAVTLVLASDSRHDATRIVPGTVRLAGASALRGRDRLRDDVARLVVPPDACGQLEDRLDGRVDLELEFAAEDVLAGWLSGAGTMREPPVAEEVALPWTALDRDGAAISGRVCAIVVGGNILWEPRAMATMGAFGPESDRDAGVGVTLDLPRPSNSADVALFDVAGRRVATLHHGPLGPGFHRLPWIVERPGPGIYFARARLDDAVLKARVLVLR